MDDVKSHGPETLILHWEKDVVYDYGVHLYAGKGTLSTSGASVSVYSGNRFLEKIDVPEGSGNDRLWYVFSFINGIFLYLNVFSPGS